MWEPSMYVSMVIQNLCTSAAVYNFSFITLSPFIQWLWKSQEHTGSKEEHQIWRYTVEVTAGECTISYGAQISLELQVEQKKWSKNNQWDSITPVISPTACFSLKFISCLCYKSIGFSGYQLICLLEKCPDRVVLDITSHITEMCTVTQNWEGQLSKLWVDKRGPSNWPIQHQFLTLLKPVNTEVIWKI